MAKKDKKTKRFGLFSALNPFRWVNLNSVKADSKRMGNIGRAALHAFKARTDLPKDFEGCMQHYKLSESDIEKLQKNALIVSWFCSALFVLIFSYAVYLICHGTVAGAFISLMLSLLAGAYAFRESFNWYRMQQRRLDCTISQWFHYLIKKGNRHA